MLRMVMDDPWLKGCDVSVGARVIVCVCMFVRALEIRNPLVRLSVCLSV